MGLNFENLYGRNTIGFTGAVLSLRVTVYISSQVTLLGNSISTRFVAFSCSTLIMAMMQAMLVATFQTETS
jgi:hypothetical protein